MRLSRLRAYFGRVNEGFFLKEKMERVMRLDLTTVIFAK